MRRAVAAHPNLPARDLVGLLADDSERVAREAAASPHLPLEHMERLLVLAGL